MKDYDQYPQGDYVPNWYVQWVRERPIINSLICLVAGLVVGAMLF